MTRDKVIIVVRGGVAEVLDAPNKVKVNILDFDELEEGFCPVCEKDLYDYDTDSVNDQCPDCGYNKNMTDEELIELAQNYYKDCFIGEKGMNFQPLIDAIANNFLYILAMIILLAYYFVNRKD
jgi:hypothetical protein